MPACSMCEKPAVTLLRYSGRHLCGAHFVGHFEQRAKAELAQQGRLPEGLIVVALSGGKDSVAVLHFLSKVVAGHPRIKLAAVTVDEGIAGYRGGSMDICRDVTTRLGIDWHVVRTRDMAGYDIDEYAAGKKGPTGADAEALRVVEPDGAPRASCGPCGVYRRLGINQKARELGAAAVVTGHNLDDMAQSILMNVLGGDVQRMARLAPHDQVKDGMVRRIIPLRTIPEKEVLLYALLEDLPIHDEAECPYAARSNRFAMRDVLLDLESKQPGTRHRLIAFHDKLKPMMAATEEALVGGCVRCGEPTSGKVCQACKWKA